MLLSFGFAILILKFLEHHIIKVFDKKIKIRSY